ncbi:RNA-directed DNA polymerase [candidate division KSB1 bacterium]|nr:RNA-directed DNA polymerase [candidate division KSB1 bacterium]
MKRQGYLIEKIADYFNLCLAFYKAQRGKSAKIEVIEYRNRLQENLTKLRSQILSGNIEIGNYFYFTIYDPKKRLICAAPFGQRVLHHALMNVCFPFFERVQIYDSYATRINKGTYAALDRAKRYNRHYSWFLKLDYRKFFDNIDHGILEKQLHRVFKDKNLLYIFKQIIGSYSVTPGKGVPIGNLTSQYFANHYLTQLDHFIKERLKIKAYVRYMDDLVLWDSDKKILKKSGQMIQQYSQEELKLTLKPFCLNQNTFGLPFLGYLLYREKIRLAFRSRIRFVKKVSVYENNYASGLWTQKEYQNHVQPLIAFTEYADTKEFRKKILAM